jgi:hypothetical protein
MFGSSSPTFGVEVPLRNGSAGEATGALGGGDVTGVRDGGEVTGVRRGVEGADTLGEVTGRRGGAVTLEFSLEGRVLRTTGGGLAMDGVLSDSELLALVAPALTGGGGNALRGLVAPVTGGGVPRGGGWGGGELKSNFVFLEGTDLYLSFVLLKPVTVASLAFPAFSLSSATMKVVSTVVQREREVRHTGWHDELVKRLNRRHLKVSRVT